MSGVLQANEDNTSNERKNVFDDSNKLQNTIIFSTGVSCVIYATQ